ncbi:unnamed protein product, partial [Musa acuminata var. zebrina]
MIKNGTQIFLRQIRYNHQRKQKMVDCIHQRQSIYSGSWGSKCRLFMKIVLISCCTELLLQLFRQKDRGSRNQLLTLVWNPYVPWFVVFTLVIYSRWTSVTAYWKLFHKTMWSRLILKILVKASSMLPRYVSITTAG